MDTAWPFYDDIHELTVVVTTCLNIDRKMALSVDIVCCIMTGLLYVNCINCTQTLRELEMLIEMLCFLLYFNFSCWKTD